MAKLTKKAKLIKEKVEPGKAYEVSSAFSLLKELSIVKFDESVDVTNCNGKGNCHHGEVCLTHDLWQDLSDRIHGFLSEISLADLVDNRTGKARLSANETVQKLILQ